MTHRRAPHNRRVVEPLDARRLLAVVINGTAGADEIILSPNPGGTSIHTVVNGAAADVAAAEASDGGILVNAGDGADTIRFEGLGGAAATLNGEGGDDQLVIGDGSIDSDQLTAAISIVGGSGKDSLTLNDSSSSLGSTLDIDSPLNTSLNITRNSVGTLLVDIGSGGGAVEQISLATGSGADAIAIHGTSAATALSLLAGDGDDVITLGDDLDSKFNGPLSIDAGTGTNDQLIVDDSADAFGDTYTFAGSGTQGTLAKNSGGATLTYGSFEHLSLIAGVGGAPAPNNQTFRVNYLPANTATTIQAGSGDDLLRIGDGSSVNVNASILAPITFLGGDDVDRIDYLDTVGAGGSNYVVNASTLEVDGITRVSFGELEALNVQAGSANNVMRVTQTLNPVNATLNGGAGDDFFLLGNGDIDTNIGNSVSVVGGAGADALFINDSGDDVGNDTYTFNAGVLNRSQRAILWSTAAADAIEYLALSGSPNDDVVRFNGGSAYTHVRVEGGNGNDSFLIARTSDGGSTNLPVTVVSGDGNDSLDVNSDFSGSDATVELTEPVEDLASLDIRSGGRLMVTPHAVQNLGRVLTVRSRLNVSGLLDLNDQTLIVRPAAASFTTVSGNVTAGYNNGVWLRTTTGPAIESTIAAGSALSDGLAVVTADSVGLPSYGGVQALSGDTIVRYTLVGDANLDRAVDFGDLLIFARNYNGTARSWQSGNFNFDAVGSVDFDDLLLLAKNFGQTLIV